MSVASRQVGTGFFEHFYLGFSPTGQYRWFVRTSNGYSPATSGGAAAVGQWVHLVGTYNGASVTLYVNGVLAFTTPHTGTIPSDTTPLTIGAGFNDAAQTPSEAFAGRVDDVRVYATALSVTDVQMLYQTTQPPPDLTPPSAPTGLTATAVSSTRIDLAWTGSTDVGPGVTAGDGFNRANGGLGAAWTPLSGTFQIVSQHVEPAAAATFTTARLTTWTGGGDQWAEAAVTVAGQGSGGGPVVRASSNGAAMYLVDYNARADHQLYRVVGGVGTPIGGGWTTPAANGDVVRLEATGSTIRVLVNGVQKLSVTDTGVTGGAPGIYAFAAAGEQVQLDTFAAASAGSVVSAAGYRVYRGGVLVTTTTSTTHADTGLQPATLYSYTVTAIDGVPNESGAAGPATATTLTAAGEGPLIDLPLDEGSGTVAGDVSGHGNNGTLLNEVSWTAGQRGGALQFDGVNDVVTVPGTALAPVTTALTVAAWVYRTSAQATWMSVASRQVGTGFFEHFYLGFSPTGQYRWFVRTSNGYSPATSGGAAAVGQWVHLVGTYNGASVTLYVNGVLAFTTPHTGTIPSDTTPLTIGAGFNDPAQTPSEGLAGRVDELRVYATALGATEVQTLYQTTQPVTAGDDFNRADGGLGSTWTELSGTFQIVSQHVEPAAAATYTTARLTTWTGGGDQWAEVAVMVTGLNSGGGPVVRAGNGGNDLYLVDYNARADHQLYRVVGGVGTPIGGGWTTPAANGDVVRLEATGSTIRVLVNGVQKLSVTDTGVTGGAPGIYAFAAAGEQVQLDTFAAASAGD